jgi:hypothetical protein
MGGDKLLRIAVPFWAGHVAAVEDRRADKTAVLLRGVARINLSNHLIENRMVRPIQSIARMIANF